MTDDQTRDAPDPSDRDPSDRDPSDRDPSDQDPSDEDFTQAWEHGDELDVGADTASFEAFRGDDTAELLRRQIHDDDAPDDSPAAHAGPDPPSGGPEVGVVVAVLAAVFVVVAVLYLLN